MEPLIYPDPFPGNTNSLGLNISYEENDVLRILSQKSLIGACTIKLFKGLSSEAISSIMHMGLY